MNTQLHTVVETESLLHIKQNTAIERQKLSDFDVGEPLTFDVGDIGRVAFIPEASRIEHLPKRISVEGGIFIGENPGSAHVLIHRAPVLKRFANWVVGRETRHRASTTVYIDKSEANYC